MHRVGQYGLYANVGACPGKFEYCFYSFRTSLFVHFGQPALDIGYVRGVHPFLNNDLPGFVLNHSAIGRHIAQFLIVEVVGGPAPELAVYTIHRKGIRGLKIQQM
jgi:hypothetical protein